MIIFTPKNNYKNEKANNPQRPIKKYVKKKYKEMFTIFSHFLQSGHFVMCT